MKIKIEKIKNISKKLPKSLASHPFLTFWVFLIVAFVASGFIFYRYSILAEKPEIEIGNEFQKFRQAVYERVILQWQQRKENLEKVGSKQYINPFLKTRGGALLEKPTPPEEIPPEEPEETIPSSLIERLLAAGNLDEFYLIKGEQMPSVRQRAMIWQEKGLGSVDDYRGFKYQNLLLLDKFKEELTK